MKNTLHLFTKNYVLFFVFLLSSIPNWAQTDILYEVPNLVPKDAIIRNWQEDKYIVYSSTSTHSWFSLIDPSAMTCVSFQTSYLGVHDFEIDDDDVFFCGNDASNPIFGLFNIPTLFSAGTGMQTFNLGGWYNNNHERITNLLKLAVQRFSDGEHIYMIGESEYATPSQTTQTRCIVDMHYSIFNGWEYDFSQEPGGIYYYDDVTVTGNEVVVIGHKHGGSGHYNTSYPQPTLAFNSLIPYGYLATYYYAGCLAGYDSFINRPLMIEHLFNDYYAIVAHANVQINGIWDKGTVLSIYNTSTTCVDRVFISQGSVDTASWKFMDLRFNNNHSRLFLLQKMRSPVSSSLESVMCVFDITTAGTISSSHAYYIPSKAYLSLDEYNSLLQTILAGGSGTSMELWHHDQGGSCANKVIFPITQITTDNNHLDYYQYPITVKANPISQNGRLDNNKLIKTCE